MLNPQRIGRSHADTFIERYERLRAWALQLTEGDHDRADDLLHDAFIQFTLSQPDLNSITDLDSYLYVCLRNLHLSQMRRATRNAAREISIVEYDSAEIGLWAIDPRDQIKTQDELRTVCHYACRRRKTSKAGSVLILRFFHGYYPEEIAKVLRITRPAVKDRLRLARAEAKLYLSDSDRLNLLHDKQSNERPKAEIGRVSDNLLNELRQTIFDSRQGDCFAHKQVNDFYAHEDAGRLSTEVVAHLVSCAKCLDEVNKILGLPLLAERYASDMAGKDTRPKGGPGGGFSGKGGGGLKASLSKYLRRTEQVYRHEPQELCVAVNGYLQSTQKISSDQSELTLVVDTPEQIGFVEVFSEQGIRLLLLNVEPPPVGSVRQDARVELSAGRTLDASLSFSGAWPTLHVAYKDQLAQEASEQLVENLLIGAKVPSSIQSTIIESGSPAVTEPSQNFLSNIPYALSRIFPVSFWLRPSTVTIAVAVLLLVAFVLLWRSKPTAPPTVADLLQRSIQAEDAALARSDIAIHRTLQIEERRGSIEGELLATQHVEIWQSAAKGVTARRLYDSRGRLVAGEWINKDKVGTLYHHGSKPQVQLRSTQSAIRSLDDVWQWELSAKEFSSLIANSGQAQVEARGNNYVISAETVKSTDNSSSSAIKNATLVLNRDDLHATEQTLTIQQDSELRFYRIVETSFERRSLNAVAPAVFEPEPELLGERMKDEGGRMKEETSSALPLTTSPPVLATPELEVEALRLLNSAGGDLSDQVTVARTSDGRLRIEGTVETERRKNEIMRALGPVSDHPAVRIAIETVAEAERKQSSAKKNPQTVELYQVEIAKAALPVEPELKRYFAGKGLSPEQIDQEINRFAGRVMRRSLQARLFARTLKQTINRFSPDDLRALTPDARQKLMTLIREQTGSLNRELSALRAELQAVVPVGGANAATETFTAGSDADLLRAINRLGELVSQIDESVRASFSISSQGAGAAAVKTDQFWKSLKSAESLAAALRER